jgi:hypothetical protein
MTVDNLGFMLDRLGKDCAPLQFLRELTQNAIEGIAATGGTAGGDVIWDVDWNRYMLEPTYKLSVVDTGIGMTGDEMVRYINALSASIHEQSISGNYGVGAKVAAATRNHYGLVYLSWKDGRGYMVHLWRDPEKGIYGLRQFERPDGTFGYWAYVDDDIKHKAIKKHGTMVVLLGDVADSDTMQPPPGTPSPSRWIARYLNTRYFRFPKDITVKAREGWEYPLSNTDTNVLRTVTGQEWYLIKHSTASGIATLTNAKARWWILKDEESLTQNSGFIASSGHVAALYQDELYELVTGRAGVAKLQSFGVIFGYPRVVIYLEPEPSEGIEITANTARTSLLQNGEPLPWSDWAAEFRSNLPDAIKALMEEVGAAATGSDYRQSIKERLRQIADLFRISRYRPVKNGTHTIDPDAIVPGGKPSRGNESGENDGDGRTGGKGGRAGDIYSLFLSAKGIPGEEIRVDSDPKVIWVSVEDGTRTAPFLEDRSAKYLVDQNLLQINADFRVFTDMIDRWHERYKEVPGARIVIRDVVREWFEQTLRETIMGAQSLRDARQWSIQDFANALSEEALTAVVLPRYHIDVAIRRALGSKLGTLKDRIA